MNHFVRGTDGVATWLAAVVILAASLTSHAQDRKSEKWAVLIGVDDYAHARKLKYAVADQQALRDELVKSGFDGRQVTLLRDKGDTKFLPFKSNIEKQIQLVCDLAERGDFVLIGFSGHGRHVAKKSYICPADGKLDESDSMIALDWVYERLGKCKADLKIVMVDACRDVDPFLGGQRGGSEPDRKEEMRSFISSSERLPDGLILLHSCSEGEKANEDEALGHGVFTHFLLQGLRGQADENKNGKVTLGELMSFSARETKLYVKDKFTDSQRPKLKGNYTIEAQDYEFASLSANSGKTLTNSIGMRFALIPAGVFEMGQSDGDDHEKPVHRVRISQPFYLGVHEVTQSQYERVMGTNPSWFSKWRGGKDKVSGLDTSNSPVESVSWDDAQDFCKKLSALTGEQTNRRQYRLPTEAEWEYACRAGTKTKFHFGDVSNGDKANVNGNYPEGTTTKGPYLERTTSVGQYAPNAFGLYDMLGNVWEWCEDGFDEKTYSKRSGLTTDPLVKSASEYRVLRGGMWDTDSRDAYSAVRFRSFPDYGGQGEGFRVVCVRLP